MSTILRQLNQRHYSVINEGGTVDVFKSRSANANLGEASAIARTYVSDTNPLQRDTLLFQTGAQTVSWITDAGDNTEPKEFGANSLIRLEDDSKFELVLTGEEMDIIAVEWLTRRGAGASSDFSALKYICRLVSNSRPNGFNTCARIITASCSPLRGPKPAISSNPFGGGASAIFFFKGRLAFYEFTCAICGEGMSKHTGAFEAEHTHNYLTAAPAVCEGGSAGAPSVLIAYGETAAARLAQFRAHAGQYLPLKTASPELVLLNS